MHAATFSPLPAVANTRSPVAAAIWIAVTPMPELPPSTSSVSLGAGLDKSTAVSTSGPPGRLISTARMVLAIIARRGGAPVAQFRVEFILDQSSGKYLAELYSPDNQQELVVRTEALYPSQAAAVLGLVQLFKDAILQFPKPGEPPAKVVGKKPKRRKPVKAKKAKKKAAKRRKHN